MVDKPTKQHYNNLLLSPSFWRALQGDKILLFEPDTTFCAARRALLGIVVCSRMAIHAEVTRLPHADSRSNMSIDEFAALPLVTTPATPSLSHTPTCRFLTCQARLRIARFVP